jgi:predicted nucleic acid-binding protein
LTLLEILVQPYRKKLDALVLKFFALLSTYPNLEWIDLDVDIADTAARLRADHRLKTPDAIQAATAICSGATGFLCNDAVFKRVKGFDCLLLDDCL